MWWSVYADVFFANLEAQRVIALRLHKLATGGAAANFEAQKMITEKVAASAEAAAILATGGSVRKVVRRYRTIIRGNEKRLTRKRRGR